MIYVFDTNSVRVLGNYYPERFPTFWEKFEELVGAGSIVSVREVYNELERQKRDTWIWEWVRSHREMFLIPGADETTFVREIFKIPHFRAIVGETQRLRGFPVADPFIAACAKVRKGCVVTEEASKPNAAKLPNVCSHFGIQYTNVEGFLTRNKWQF